MTELREQLQKSLGDAYTLERELGGGGMSRVFIAEDSSLGRKVVVKVLPPDLAATVNVERFRREIQLAARLQHPHIVPVLSAGISEGLPYYTMPFIEGESLRARLARSGELPIQEAVRILRDVLSALSYAHEHGVVHRDIKPDNILLTGSHALVADFGVAKALSASTNAGSSLTSLGVALGTPAYMAPEQAAADPAADHRADVYGVGAVAYEMLTGHQVFSARSPQAMLAAHAVEKPEPVAKRRPTVPSALSALVMRALEKHAADRQQSAGEMLGELEAAVTPSGATAPTAVHGTSASWWPRRTALASLAVVAVVIAGAAYGISSRWFTQHGAAASTSSTEPHLNAVAVIPFANTGGDPRDEYFSDGMTDELAHALSRLPQLRVAGRSSSYSYKGKAIPSQEIGRALNVSAVVEGSIRRAGKRVRIIAQLTNAADGRVMWSDAFESSASDLFQVQDDFTREIVQALTPALRGGTAASAASTSRGTHDQEAYELYLKGRYFFAKRGTAGLKRAISYFERAAAKDPTFARARAGMSMAFSVLGGYEASDSTPGLAMKNALLAVALDSTLADAHLALANAYCSTTELNKADAEFHRALRLQPEDALTHQWYGDNLEILGRAEEALVEEKRASALDPLSAVITHEVAYALFLNHRFEEAVSWSRRAVELDSTLAIAGQQLALDLVHAGRSAEAINVAARTYALDPLNLGGLGVVVYANAAGGRWADVRAVYRAAVAKRGKIPDLDEVVVRLSVGDRKRAMDIFEHLTRNGFDQIPYGCDPQYDPLHDDPRFMAIMRRYGAGVCPLTPWPIKAAPAGFSLEG
jgi:serine/threonine-protein kinase